MRSSLRLFAKLIHLVISQYFSERRWRQDTEAEKLSLPFNHQPHRFFGMTENYLTPLGCQPVAPEKCLWDLHYGNSQVAPDISSAK
jgi:hypothetical protein